MFNILYYYYYLFNKLFTQEDVHIWAILHLSLFQALILNTIIYFFLEKYLGLIPPTYVGVSVTAIIILLNYLYFIKSERYKEILKTKPKLLSSHWLSVLFAGFFGLGSMFLFLYGLDMILGN